VVEADPEQRGGPEVAGGDRRGSKWLAHCRQPLSIL
jgi:hypothetical protein